MLTIQSWGGIGDTLRNIGQSLELCRSFDLH